MPLRHDIDPGLYADQDGVILTVTDKRTPDGRFIVHHRHGVGGSYILSGRTIRQLYPKFVGALAAVAVLAFAGIADAKPASSALLARAAASVQATIKQTILVPGGNFAPNATFRVTCKGTAKRIVCTAVKTSGAGPAFEESETFKVVHGKLQASTLTHAPMARVASASLSQGSAQHAAQQFAQGTANTYNSDPSSTGEITHVAVACNTRLSGAKWSCQVAYFFVGIELSDKAVCTFTVSMRSGQPWVTATAPHFVTG